MINCDIDIFKLSDNDITKLSNVIVHGQDIRIKLSKEISKSVNFNFGMRSKTRYGSKAIMQLINKSRESIKPFLNILHKSCTKNRAVVYGSVAGVSIVGSYLCTNQINDALTTYNKLLNIFPFIDLGFRVNTNMGFSFEQTPPPSREDPMFMITFIVNLALFGTTMVNNWEAYLMTPAGSKVILDLISSNPIGLLSMLTHANIFGTSETDIISYFLKFNKPMCTPESFGKALTRLEKMENNAKAFLINRAAYHVITLSGSYGFYAYIANYPIYKIKQYMSKKNKKNKKNN